jgi:hypothetical protein
MFNMSVKHNRTLDEARTAVERSVNEARNQLGPMVQRVEWSADRSRVKMSGTGFVVEIWADPQDIHVEGDLPLLNNLLGGPLGAGLKKVLQQTVERQLLTRDPRPSNN